MEYSKTTTWTDFIRAHMPVFAGTDFFSVEVLTLRGLVTYYVAFRLLGSRDILYFQSPRKLGIVLRDQSVVKNA